jgi:two-component system sensor histidine kinase KdpD
LQIGALAVEIHPMVLADTVASALQSVNVEPDRLEVSIPHGLPLVLGDPTLLERSLANVISNAVRYSPAGVPVRVEAALVGDEVHLRVVDRGPGVPGTERARVLSPFQRLGDQRTSDGVGLGFSIAQGFVTAMHGSLTLDDTPGGGLTVTIVLPKAAEVAA